jgi:hypothetical protein
VSRGKKYALIKERLVYDMALPFKTAGGNAMRAQQGDTNMTPYKPQTSGGGGQKKDGLIAVNDLNYVLPPDLSVSVNRTHTNHYFQSAQYSNQQRAICILNSGAHYGDMRLSSLEFGVQLTAPTVGTVRTVHGWFGQNGSAMNLIESITISSRSGDEISRIDQCDLLKYVTTGFRNTSAWMDTVGKSMGTNAVVLASTHNRNTSYFSIPLYCLSDIFAYGRILPPGLLSGLRISITWTSPQKAFVINTRLTADGTLATPTADDRIPSYTITNPFVSMYAVQLTDGVQRALNELSATNGLEIVYCDWEATEAGYTTSTNTHVQLEVRKAASRALKAFAVTRNTTNTLLATEDSYATLGWDYRKWQWQLGSLYFPQQPVLAGTENIGVDAQTANILPESYKHALIAFGGYKNGGKTCATPYRDTANHLESNFANKTTVFPIASATPWEQVAVVNTGTPGSLNGQWGTYAHGMSVIGCLLERSDLFNLSGVPINNSRVLSFRAQYNSPSTQVRTLTVFLKYVRLARVFLNNVEVEQ